MKAKNKLEGQNKEGYKPLLKGKGGEESLTSQTTYLFSIYILKM